MAVATPMIQNLINSELRAEWARRKWEFMEEVQDLEPHLWLGWYDLIAVAPISPNGGMYNHA